jgi:hypothetical protein
MRAEGKQDGSVKECASRMVEKRVLGLGSNL